MNFDISNRTFLQSSISVHLLSPRLFFKDAKNYGNVIICKNCLLWRNFTNSSFNRKP